MGASHPLATRTTGTSVQATSLTPYPAAAAMAPHPATQPVSTKPVTVTHTDTQLHSRFQSHHQTLSTYSLYSPTTGVRTTRPRQRTTEPKNTVAHPPLGDGMERFKILAACQPKPNPFRSLVWWQPWQRDGAFQILANWSVAKRSMPVERRREVATMVCGVVPRSIHIYPVPKTIPVRFFPAEKNFCVVFASRKLGRSPNPHQLFCYAKNFFPQEKNGLERW